MTLGGRLALLTARKALGAAGLDPSMALTPASSVTNEVWLGNGIVLRIGSTRRRLLREAELARELPPAVGYPRILHSGNQIGVEFMVLERLDARPLAHAWADLDPADRQRATMQLASRVRALHDSHVVPHSDIESPQFVPTNALGAEPKIIASLRAAAARGFDSRLLGDAETRVRALAPALAESAHTVLVHGDLTFENVLWDGDRVVAVLDLEFAARRPIDLELEPLLRLCGHPDLHVADEFVGRVRPEDFADVPRWFREEYDAPFRVTGLVDRLNLYAIGFCAWELTTCSPTTNPPPGHPIARLKQILAGTGYIDRFLAP